MLAVHASRLTIESFNPACTQTYGKNNLKKKLDKIAAVAQAIERYIGLAPGAGASPSAVSAGINHFENRRRMFGSMSAMYNKFVLKEFYLESVV